MNPRSPFEVINIEFDTITGKILKTYTFDSIYEGAVGFVQCQKEYLKDCLVRKVSPNPELTKWKIRMYEFILAAENPEETFYAYMKKKKEMNMPGDERPVIEALGWKIP